MKNIAWLLVLMSWCHSSSAGPIAEHFVWGIFGVPWGTSLDSMVEMFPNGDHVYAITPGGRAYLVRDDQEFIGVARNGYNVLYAFDQKNELVGVSLMFPYERKQDLLRALISAFGAPHENTNRGQNRIVSWRKDEGVSLILRTSLDPKHGIAWLGIRGPSYSSDVVTNAWEPTR